MIASNNINTFELRKFIKIILLLLAVLISILTLYLSQRLVNKIAIEETKNMEIWCVFAPRVKRFDAYICGIKKRFHL